MTLKYEDFTPIKTEVLSDIVELANKQQTVISFLKKFVYLKNTLFFKIAYQKSKPP